MLKYSENAVYDLKSENPESEPVNKETLGLFQKILLTMDGTLTEILEIYMSESIKIVKLSEELKPSASGIPIMAVEPGRDVMERKVVLQGVSSGKNCLYAESIIVPHCLEKRFRDGLIKSNIPIGKLWQDCKTETFKEVVATFCQPAGYIADYFKVERTCPLLCRTYLVYSDRKPVMMITEKFPETYFI
ncbi:MAG: chorismate pyruvate-lyase family protein [Desulfobacterales bacterium]|nr:chorismate pyruvate-lyase family protein [Desulfobacterales bacterium]